MRCFLGLSLLLCAAVHAAHTPEQIEFFEKRIRPVLAQECYECHSVSGQKKGGLLLDSREGWKAGGKSGAAIVPGDISESLLLQSIRHDDEAPKMPKNGAKLDERTIKDFEAWVKMGAPDPREKPSTPEEIAKDKDWSMVLARRKNWWSFQPVQNPPVPVVKNSEWSTHPVDKFLFAKMETEKLAPSNDTDPRALIRRLNDVLIGLPPTPEESDSFTVAFEKDPQSAIDSAADRLLASPRFGERWARHWMDWVRYAETHGSEGDPQIPHVWRYRDYLIRALNADVPYEQLVREHIAGDLLSKPRINQEMGINESAIGAAHYRMVLHGFSPTDSLDEMVTFTDNQIDTVSKAFLGLTVSCTRCHNHKFDAISQADFYAMFGIFASGRPALIDVNLPERKKLHAQKLAELKGKIRSELATEWLARTDSAIDALKKVKADAKSPAGPLAAWQRLTALPPEKWDAEWKRMQAEWKDYSAKLEAFRNQPSVVKWNLSGADLKNWVADGVGVESGARPAGDFNLAHDGDQVIAGIFRAGAYSNPLTKKHRAMLSSPNFNCDGGKIWIRLRGDVAQARYVVRNYTRSGTIHHKREVTSEGDQWIEWNVDYWKGDMLHLEISTSGEPPVETKDNDRSWFGVSEILYAKDAKGPGAPPPYVSLLSLCDDSTAAPKSADDLAVLYSSMLKRCVENWRASRMSDDEADFLAAFAKQDLLPKFAKLPSIAALVSEYRRLENEIPLPTRVPGLIEGFAFDQALYERGNHKQPREIVKRRFLEAVDTQPYEPGSAHSGRLNLAESMVSPENPFIHRVIANRLWQYVFGQGIVGSPDNFGRLGDPPTHPEVLDYLATRLRTEGGSLKKMIRLLVTSRTFRLSHVASSDAATRDPGNKWLTHYSMHRRDAESIRDSMVFLSGKIDTSLGGLPAESGSHRRSVYLKVVRNHLDPLLTAFDFPVPAAPRGRRDSTNVPAQSLALLNGPLVERWATDWAKRILAMPAGNDSERIGRMYREAFGRSPDSSELKLTLEYLQSFSVDRDGDKSPANPEAAWRSLAQALFNAKEFIYVR